MKKHLRAVGALGLTVASIAALTGCGATPSASGQSKVVHITYWEFFSSRYKALKSIVAEFNKTHPNIQVTVYHEPSNYTMFAKLLTALADGTAPNVVGQWGPYAYQLAKTPGVLPLTSFIKASHYNLGQFFQPAVSTGLVNGVQIGLPADNDAITVLYNKALFKKYHVPYPTSNWTWSQMVTDARLLNHPSQKNYGFLMPVGNTEGVTWRWEPFLWQAGGHITNTSHSKPTFGSAAGIKALTFFQHLTKYSDVVARAEHQTPFEYGHVAMTLSGSWQVSYFKAAHLDYGVAPLPSPYAGGPHTTIAGPDLNLITKSTPAKEQASWVFLRYLESPQSSALLASYGHLPYNKLAFKTAVFQKTLKEYPLLNTFAAIENQDGRIRPKFPQYSEVSQDMGNAIESVVLGKLSPKQALAAQMPIATQQMQQSAP